MKRYALNLQLLFTIPLTVGTFVILIIFDLMLNDILLVMGFMGFCLKNWTWLIMLMCFDLDLLQLLIDFLNVSTELKDIFGIQGSGDTNLPTCLIIRQLLYCIAFGLAITTICPLFTFLIPSIIISLVLYILILTGMMLLQSFFNIAFLYSPCYLHSKRRNMADIWRITRTYLNLFQLLSTFEKMTRVPLILEYFLESLLFVLLLASLFSGIDNILKFLIVFLCLPVSVLCSYNCITLLHRLHATKQELCNMLLQFDMRFTWFKLNSLELFYLEKAVAVEPRVALWETFYINKSVVMLYVSFFTLVLRLMQEMASSKNP